MFRPILVRKYEAYATISCNFQSFSFQTGGAQMLTMSGFHGTKHFVTRARKNGLWRITADYGGLCLKTGLRRIMADYGGFRRIMADLGGLWRI